MKSRNREINIFNMSLLDILCGALGTFCFMMIVLFPYYSATPSNAPEMPKDMVDPKTFQEAMDQIKKLKEALQKLQDYAQSLEGQSNQQKQQIAQQQQQIQQLQQQLDDLKKRQGKQDEYVSQLEFRRPFIGIGFFGVNRGDVWQMWWDTDRIRGDKTEPFKMDPTKLEDVNVFVGDLYATSGNVSYHVLRDNRQGIYKLVLKLVKHDGAAMPLRGWAQVEMWDFRYVSPYLKVPTAWPVVIPIATIELAPPPSTEYNFKWTFPPELNDEPDWKPNYPDNGKQQKQDKK